LKNASAFIFEISAIQ